MYVSLMCELKSQLHDMPTTTAQRIVGNMKQVLPQLIQRSLMLPMIFFFNVNGFLIEKEMYLNRNSYLWEQDVLLEKVIIYFWENSVNLPIPSELARVSMIHIYSPAN